MRNGVWKNDEFELDQSIRGKSWLAVGAGAQVTCLLPLLVGWGITNIQLVRRSFSASSFRSYVRSVFRNAHCEGLQATFTSYSGEEVRISGSTDHMTAAGAADIISVHLPHREETTKAINAEFLSACKSGASIITVSRGDVVDEDAIIQCLRSGKLFAYAADSLTFEVEQTRKPGLSELFRAQYGSGHNDSLRILLTPHIGGTEKNALLELTTDVGTQLATDVGAPNCAIQKILADIESENDAAGVK